MESQETIFILIAIYLGISLLTIPMIRQKLKPNSFYGFRVRATLNNRDLWYRYNRLAGFWLLGLSVLTIFALVYAAVINGADPDFSEYLAHSATIGFTIALVINTFVLMVLAEREWKKLRPSLEGEALVKADASLNEKDPA